MKINLRAAWRGRAAGVRTEFLRYAVVGAVATVFDYGTVVLLVSGLSWNYLWANALGYAVGTVVNYFLSVRWVFARRSVGSPWAEFFLFTTAGLGGLGISQLVLWTGVEQLGLHYTVAKAFAVGGHFFWNFASRKVMLFWTPDPKPVVTTTAVAAPEWTTAGEAPG